VKKISLLCVKSAIREVLAFRHRLQFKKSLGFSDIVVDLNGVASQPVVSDSGQALPSPFFSDQVIRKRHSRYYLYIK